MPGIGSKVVRCSGSSVGRQTALLQDLPLSRLGRFLALLNQAAEQLVAPLIDREPIPLQHQRLVPLVHDEGDCHPGPT